MWNLKHPSAEMLAHFTVGKDGKAHISNSNTPRIQLLLLQLKFQHHTAFEWLPNEDMDIASIFCCLQLMHIGSL